MGTIISVHAVLAEQDDGTYKATCPDLGIELKGQSADETSRSLNDAIANHIRNKILEGNLRLNAVKCMKIKIEV